MNEIVPEIERCINNMEVHLNSARRLIESSMVEDGGYNIDIYFEKVDVKRCEGSSISLLRHLLKIKYSDDFYFNYDNDISHWKNEINGFQSEIIRFSKDKKAEGKINTNCIKEVNNNMQELYKKCITRYYDDCNDNRHLLTYAEFIPEECPYTFEDLLYKDIDELLNMLPDIEKQDRSGTQVERMGEGGTHDNVTHNVTFNCDVYHSPIIDAIANDLLKQNKEE